MSPAVYRSRIDRVVLVAQLPISQVQEQLGRSPFVEMRNI
jgi:hypothetical protein